MSSSVNHPSHYNQGKIEVIEFIEDKGLSFHRGNAVKYIARAGKKDPAKEIEDLEKAAWYIAREIERLKAARENREPVRPNDMNAREPKPANPAPVAGIARYCVCGHGAAFHAANICADCECQNYVERKK